MRGDNSRKPKRCYFLDNNITVVDFTDVAVLKRFLTDRGKILPRRITGVSSFYQRQLSKAVKTARQSGLLAPILSEEGGGGPRRRY